MFSLNQKREIADAVQKILRDTDHPELPETEIQFLLHVDGAESWSWADIRNNGAVTNPGINPWNESQAQARSFDIGDSPDDTDEERDQKVRAWMEKNPWCEAGFELLRFALGIHWTKDERQILEKRKYNNHAK